MKIGGLTTISHAQRSEYLKLALYRMTAFDGGFKGSMQHPPRASNRNTNSMLNLYLFKGRDSTVTFTRSNQDSRRLWRTVGTPWVSKACPIAKGSVASTG
jgi:hypothetical protein